MEEWCSERGEAPVGLLAEGGACLAASGLHALHLFCRCSDDTGEGVFIHAGQGALPGVGPRDYVQPVPGL